MYRLGTRVAFPRLKLCFYPFHLPNPTFQNGRNKRIEMYVPFSYILFASFSYARRQIKSSSFRYYFLRCFHVYYRAFTKSKHFYNYGTARTEKCTFTYYSCFSSHTSSLAELEHRHDDQGRRQEGRDRRTLVVAAAADTAVGAGGLVIAVRASPHGRRRHGRRRHGRRRHGRRRRRRRSRDCHLLVKVDAALARILGFDDGHMQDRVTIHLLFARQR
jgi:hypothetical protein